MRSTRNSSTTATSSRPVLKLEEDRFQQAFENGYSILSESLGMLEGADVLPGDVVFRLWDTHGFPVEMTQEIAAENDVDIDMEGFEREMAAQREQSRAGAQFGEDRAKIRVYESLGVGGTAFLGYESLRTSTVVVGLIAEDQVANEVSEGQDVEIVLLQTPFYAEGGGQIGDAGDISGDNGRIAVTDTQEVMPGLIVHFGRVAAGSVSLGETVDAHVDPIRREDTARNHTATHLLHAALRQVLGLHVRQAGSLVAPDRLRFDFTHVQPVTDDEMWQVQLLVNEKIQAERTHPQGRRHIPGGDKARRTRFLRRPLRRAGAPRRDRQRRHVQLRGLRRHACRPHRRGRGRVRARRVEHRRRHEAHRGH